ncbi:hypothetical protein [Methylobacterium oxalidis]|uniref:hypothetical protein n=1 Tax=Methylobacterium oxalidis TaxID=944322 RepID=UPI003314E136
MTFDAQPDRPVSQLASISDQNHSTTPDRVSAAQVRPEPASSNEDDIPTQTRTNEFEGFGSFSG